MLVDHFRKDFMDLIAGQRVIIIAHQDVDSLCTVKILTTLFKTEGVPYILLSCDGIRDLRLKYQEYCSQSDWYILVNCGGSVDIVELLENPPLNKVFFVLDNHRPLHVINYYNSTGQIRFISVPEPEENVPEFDQVFAEEPELSDSEEEEDSDEDDDGMTAQMRRRADRQQRRRDYEKWKDTRERILYNYRENSYYARPSALYALEVAWVMSRDDMDSIWCTIIALTDSFVSGRLSREKYTEFASTVNDHILRITNAEKLPRDCLKIRFEQELCMYLYRNWSVYESAKMTPYIVNNLRTWTVDGNRRFHQLLAQLGLPLMEVKQNYLNMSMDLRRQLVQMFSSEIAVEKYRLPDLVFGSFVAEIGYRAKFNALDMQLSALALLEDPDSTKTTEVKFLEAMQVLNVRDQDVFKSGIEKAKAMLKLLYTQVQTMVDTKQMQEIGPFLFLQLSESLVEFNYFKRPASIPILVHFLQHAGVRCGKRKWMQCPWIVMIPYNAEHFIAVGVQPGAFEQEVKSVFGEVFRVIHSRMPEDVILDYFDQWAILVSISKRQDFTNHLLAISE